MKKFILSFFILSISLIICSEAKISGNTPSALAPFDEDQSALSAIIWGKPKLGYAYLINGGSTLGLRTLQSTNYGVVILANLGNYFSDNVPNRFFVETSRLMADGEALPAPFCGVYSGLYRYKTVLGSIATIHKFREVSCKPYIEKYKKEVEKDKADQVHYHQWFSGPNGNTIGLSVFRLMPNEKIPIDFKRWHPIYQVNNEDFKATILIDKMTVKNELSSITNQNVKNAAIYKFWQGGFMIDGDTYLIRPTERLIDCFNKKIDGKIISNIKIDQSVYKYFCSQNG